MVKISKAHSLSQQYKPGCKLTMLLLILLAICVFSWQAEAETSIYVFSPDQSAVVKTGGFAGVHETYAVAGQFRLAVDSDSSVALFEMVDANLADEAGSEYGRSLNEIFNMTGLAGTVVDDMTIEFEGKTADGTESDVRLKLSFIDDSSHLTGKTTPPPDSADMFFYDIDAVTTKKYAGGTGESDNPYLIFTPEQMNTIGTEPNDWDKHFKLMEDIDLVGYIGTDLNIIGYWVDWSSPYNKPFAGVFEGNGHTISNFTSQGTNRMGLFGYVDGKNAHIKDLGLIDPNIDARRYVGSLVGHMRMGVITNCYVEGGSVGGSSNVGGLVGFQDYGTITNCYTTVSVSGDTYTGGLVGNNNWWCRISDCYSTASVSGKEYVGGLVGLNRGTIANCYVQGGSVLGSNIVGGFVGSNGWPQLPMARPYPTGEITNCYSTASVSGNNHVGGLVGRQGYGRVTASFWDKESSGQTISDDGTGKTTAEMQMASTFIGAGWDFVDEASNGTEDIWWILEGRDYPRLSWERVLGDDFEDAEALPLWQVYEPDSEKIRVEETNGRLEVLAIDTADDIVAGYVSSGWRLDVTSDFAIKVNFYFGKRSVGDSWLLLLLLPSLDEPIDRYVEIEAGCIDNQPFYLYEEVDGALMQEVSTSRDTDDGTLYISYNSEQDQVYLSYTGYGKANAWQTVEGYLQNRWAAQPVYVAIGGGSDQVVLDTGDAYLDNFVIDSGLLDFSVAVDDTGDI